MAITKTTEISSATVTESGYIEYYKITKFFEDGEQIGDSGETLQVMPGDPVPAELTTFISAKTARP